MLVAERLTFEVFLALDLQSIRKKERKDERCLWRAPVFGDLR